MNILVFNGGSSTYKLAIYSILDGLLELPKKALWIDCIEATSDVEADQKEIKSRIDQAIKDAKLFKLDLIAHRVVHGGDRFQSPVVITDEVKMTIKELIPLAPLHNPVSLRGIEWCSALFQGVCQVAVFDTAFHHTLSLAASTYPGPYAWKEMGIKRFGFHGISYQYCSARAHYLLKLKDPAIEASSIKMLCCHLGNGASMAAIAGGQSIDTTMGFTPLDGLMMGTRPGSLDPGILLYLQESFGKTEKELFYTLNEDSGLKGISGVSHDMQEIVKLKQKGDMRGSLAYDMYVHSLKRHAGAMAAVLGGIDVIVFTGGIGEHHAGIREEVCSALKSLGVELDLQKNKECKPDSLITKENSKVKGLVIQAEEDWCMAINALLTQ